MIPRVNGSRRQRLPEMKPQNERSVQESLVHANGSGLLFLSIFALVTCAAGASIARHASAARRAREFR